MPRKPQPGSDEGTWGTILNDFLTVSHNDDGTLRDDVVKPSIIDAGDPNTGQVLSYDGTGLAWATMSSSGAVPDADGSTKGLIQLAGDLDGTASAPTVPGLATKADTSALNTHVADTTNPHATNKSQLGLSNVDNTSDIDKPLSTAAQTALSLKADDAALTTHIGDFANPHAVDAFQIGLDNVNNTSDADKPISTAAQTALDLKAPLASPTFTGVVTVPTPVNTTDAATKTYVDTVASSGTPDADAVTKGKLQLTGDLGGTSASPTVPGLAAKADITAVNLKADLASPTFTGTVTVPAPSNGTDASTKTYVDTGLALKANLASPTFTGTVTVPTPTTNTDAATKNYVDTVASSGTPDADATTKGKLQLTGDLGGTAASPTVPGLAGKADTSHIHAAADVTSGTVATARLGSGTANTTTFLRGDSSWTTLSSAGNMTAVAQSTTYSANAFEYIVADATSGGFTITLPAVSNGTKVSVKKVDSSANAITVTPLSGLIDNLASDAINTQWVSMDYFSDGTKWYRV